MPRKRSFSKYIRDARIALGKSRRELADQIGVTYASIGFWETDWCRPTEKHLRALCKALKLSIPEAQELAYA